MTGKIAILDFCGTIVNFQTADEFVHYHRMKHGGYVMKMKSLLQKLLWKSGIIMFLTKKYPKASINKRMILWQLKGESRILLEASANDFYINRIKPNFIPEMISEITRLKDNGYTLLLVSGGYDIYLKYFADEFDISSVLATRIGFRDNVCLGTFDGNDCLWEEKVRRVEYCIGPNSDIEHSVSYSDSISDLPIMQWTDEAYVVRRHNQSNWGERFHFKDIVW